MRVHHYLAAICSEHIAMGLPNPLQDHPQLQQLLWVIHRQQPLPQPDSGCQGITMEFLCRARPLHHLHLPRNRVLWPALTMGHYGLFQSGELVQPKLAEAGVPQFIHVQDVTPHFSRGCLHYIHVLLSSSKMDPFHQGCPVIIWLHQHFSVWSLQGLACPTAAPAGMDFPGCPLPRD